MNIEEIEAKIASLDKEKLRLVSMKADLEHEQENKLMRLCIVGGKLCVCIGNVKVLDVSSDGKITLYQYGEDIKAFDRWRAGGCECSKDVIERNGVRYRLECGLFGADGCGDVIFDFNTMTSCSVFNLSNIKKYKGTNTPIINVKYGC